VDPSFFLLALENFVLLSVLKAMLMLHVLCDYAISLVKKLWAQVASEPWR
jgi:hypothetical protein